MDTAAPERFVDANVAAEFLQMKARRVLELARAGDLPGYPILRRSRRTWRFRLSDLAAAMERLATNDPLVYAEAETSYRSKPTKRSANGR